MSKNLRRISDRVVIMGSQSSHCINIYKQEFKLFKDCEFGVTISKVFKGFSSNPKIEVKLTIFNTGYEAIKVLEFGWCKFPELNEVDFVLQPNDAKSLLLQTDNGTILAYVIELDTDQHITNENAFLDEIGATKTNDAFADATLLCEGEEIRCHRVILAARSGLFETMFTQNDFKEGASKQVKVKEMPLATLKAMIDYIYSNQFDLETDISALFSAAHLYRINGLVVRCVDIMINTLAVENAAEFFFKGFLTDNTALKTGAMDFIIKNFAAVKTTDGWANFMEPTKSSKALEDILEFAIFIR
jgi:hypothetical protein